MAVDNPPPSIDPTAVLGWVESLPPRLEPAHPTSALMATLMSHLLEHPAAHAEARRRLQDRLLDLTVRMAREHCPYYRARVPERATPWDFASLDELPPLGRAEAYAHNRELIAGITTFGFTTFTSGTSRQPPLLIERSVEEQRYIHNFFTHLQRPLMDRDPGPAPLGLVEGFLDHGSVLRAPAWGYSFVVELAKDTGQVRASWLLQHDFDLPGFERRIGVLQGSFHSLYYLCHYLRESGVELPEGQIRSVTCFGAAVPRWSRDLMSEILGVPVGDNYSMAEIFGGARYCHDCDAYHFDPFAVPEVIDPDTGARVDEGCGELVLTPLFPFCQRFVLLRYRTADLAEVRSTDCPRGERGYTLRGRIQNAIRIGPRQERIGESEIANAIDGVGEINRSECGLTLIADGTVAEPPRFTMAAFDPDDKMRLTLELRRVDPRDTAAVDGVRARIRSAVLGGLPAAPAKWLGEAPERLSIEFVPSGSLPDRHYWNL